MTSPHTPGTRRGALARTVRWSGRHAQRLSSHALSAAVSWLEKRIDQHSTIGAGPFFPTESFTWPRSLEKNWKAIRQELDQMLAYRDDLPNFQDISPEQRLLTDDDRWKTYFFYGYGFRFAGNCAQCPRTATLLAGIPALTTAFFSVLGPHKRLPEHRGPYKGVIRYHLGLKIPSPPEACGIRVGGETAHWQEGKSLLFDDTYQHEAWNDTDEDRVVLFLDIVRPMPFPYSWLNALVITAVGRTSFVRNARRNHADWEQRFEELRAQRERHRAP